MEDSISCEQLKQRVLAHSKPASRWPGSGGTPLATDATPSYRGYRSQALYTLFRLIEAPREQATIFQPEGYEDLAVFDADDRLVEVIQVKDLSDALSLSSFDPHRSNSFFYRAASMLKANPGLVVKAVSFGEIGPELLQAVTKDGNERKKVSAKLSGYGSVSEKEAYDLVGRLQLVPVNRADLVGHVDRVLRDRTPRL